MPRTIRCTCWRDVLVAMGVLAAGLMVVSAARADIFGLQNGNPNLWTANHAVNGDAPSFHGDSVTLTTDMNDEHNSVFYNHRQSVTGFTVTFTYQAGGATAADGVTFCVQNDPHGPHALGTLDGGSALGYQGIQSSAAIALNIYAVQNPHFFRRSFRGNGFFVLRYCW